MAPPRITVRDLSAGLAASVEHFRGDTAAVERSRARVEAALSDGRPHYGMNTGFGVLANTRVPDDPPAPPSGTGSSATPSASATNKIPPNLASEITA